MRSLSPQLRSAFQSALLVASCAALSTGCSVISDLDRFEQQPKVSKDGSVPDLDAAGGEGDAATAGDGGVSNGCGNPATLCVQLSGFEQYKGQLLVVDLVTEDGVLRARAMLDPGGDEAKQAIVMPLAIPEEEIPSGEEHPLHVEVWADKDDDRVYDADEDDGYRIGLPANGVLDYARNDDDLVDLSPGPTGEDGKFVMNLSGFQIHPKRMFEAMVIETSSGRTLGLVRFGSIPSDGIFTIDIPGVIAGGAAETDYTIEFYADANNDGTYNGVGPDHSWVLPLKSTAAGIEIDRTHSAPSSGPLKGDPSFKFAPLTYQFPFAN